MLSSKITAVSGYLARVACLAVVLFSAGAALAEPTNVVLILIDDLSHYGVSAYGATGLRSHEGAFADQALETPNIDRLAREGLLCRHAYTHPLCENTRVALMTGRGNDRNFLRPKALHKSSITFGDVFQRAGYATGLFGKWKQSRGDRDTPGKRYLSKFGWDESIAFDVITEGNRYINPNLVVNGEVVNYTGRTDLDPVTGRRWYGPDIINRGVLDFIDRHRGEPFFLYYPMLLVHDEHQPTPDTRPASLFDTFDETADDRRYFPDMLAYTDKLIGRVVDKLEALSLREQTLVIVMGDNGTKETFAHLLPGGAVYPARKGGNADNGLHVPLVLSQPGVIPVGDGKRVYDAMVDVTDLYPTIAEAAGVEVPNADQLDGISFWHQATGGAGEHRDTIYHWYIGNATYKDDDKLLRFAFDKQFKRYAPTVNYPAGRFFDLRTDLLEQAGDRVIKFRFNVKRRSGLTLDELTAEQRAAYDRLGRVLEENAISRVTGLEIAPSPARLAVGERLTLSAHALPANARRSGVIWESSDPSVADINKFGELVGRRPGRVEVTAYSWDDAEPLANGPQGGYRRDGVSATQGIEIR